MAFSLWLSSLRAYLRLRTKFALVCDQRGRFQTHQDEYRTYRTVYEYEWGRIVPSHSFVKIA